MRAKILAGTALGVAIPLLAASGAAPQDERGAGVSGRFSLIQMVHTQTSIPQYQVPATEPWTGAFRSGLQQTYRSIACTGNAPVNNIASDLPSYGARVPASRAPSSMRAHPLYFKLRRVDGRIEMRGTITFTVCKLAGGPVRAPDPVPDVDKPKIHVQFTATPVRMNADNIRFAGRFKLVGGTQRYRGLRGEGRIAGYFFCFNPQGCRVRGLYEDAQFVMEGTYRDRTPMLRR